MTLGKNWYINTSTEFDDFFSALTAMDSLTLLEEKNIFHFQERTNYGNAYISSYVQTADGKQRP